MTTSDIDADLPVAVIDLEASAYPMPGSYPIEVALAYVKTGAVRSWLIKPIELWVYRWIWDPAAEKIHGISMATLQAQGRAIQEVRVELAAAAAGHRIVSDAVAADNYWAWALFGRSAPFQLASVYKVVEDLAATRSEGPTAAEAERTAALRYPERHRAGPDARRWAEVLRILMGFA